MMAWHRASFLWIVVLAAIAMAPCAGRAAEKSCAYTISVPDDPARIVDVAATCIGVPTEAFYARSDAQYWRLLSNDRASHTAQFEFDLPRLAEKARALGQAMPFGSGFLVAPEALLPLPENAGAMALSVRFEFANPNGAVVTALTPSNDGTFNLHSRDLDDIGPFLLGNAIDVQTLPGDPSLRLALPDSGFKLSHVALFEWASAVAQANRRFWGQSPVPAGLLILVPAFGRDDVPFGRVLPEGGVSIAVLVGADAEPRALYDDWVLTHELLHLGSPVMRDTGAWLNEGIATLYEPVIRARSGWKTEDEVWREWVSQMPRGLPAMSDIGLSSAGRGGIYWGGAMFVLMAEIEALNATDGKIGFSDCLRRLAAEGANTTDFWPSRMLVSRCDSEIGFDRIGQMFADHVQSGTAFDLSQMWQKLGVKLLDDGAIEYNNDAEWAWMRPYIVWGGEQKPQPIASDGFYRPD